MDASTVDGVIGSLLAGIEGTRARRALPPMSRSALVLLDLQRVFIDPASPAYTPAFDAVARRAGALARAFEHKARPVALTRHLHPQGDAGGTLCHMFGRLLTGQDPLSDIAPGWGPGPCDILVHKARHSAFAGTALAERLCGLGVDVVVLAGVQAHLCVLATAVEAGSHDLMPIVAIDAVAAPTLALHRAAIEAMSGGIAWIATVEEIEGALESAGAVGHE